MIRIRKRAEGTRPLLIPDSLLTEALAIFSNYATMRFEPESLHGANAGLNVARNLMEKIKEEFPWISYGDLWTLGGVCAIQVRDQK